MLPALLESLRQLRHHVFVIDQKLLQNLMYGKWKWSSIKKVIAIGLLLTAH